MRKLVENGVGLTNAALSSDHTQEVRHPLAIECDSLAELGQSAMRLSRGITFPSRHRSTRALRRGRLPS